MAFPSSPANGQTTTVGNIIYTYNSTLSAWQRTTANGNLTALSTGTITVSNGIFWTNGLAYSATGLTSVGVLNGLTVSGNILPNSNANVNLGSSVAYWSSIYSAAGTFNNIATANITTTTLTTTTSNTSGTATVGNLITTNGVFWPNGAPYSAGSGSSFTSLSVSGTATIATLTITGNETVSGTITANTVNAATIGNTGATLAGTLSTSSQPNITTVGTLTGLTVSGNITSQNIVPGANASYNLGSTTAWWNNVYGTAVHAQYADLAEKYLADWAYPMGTVVAVGGDAEVTACTPGDLAIGVVSANPAFKMNSALADGIYIALKGRVPVLVEGTVKKGQRLTAGGHGCAVVAQANIDVFAVALESSDDANIKLIEAVIL